jgi:signal transduction histidine kinase
VVEIREIPLKKELSDRIHWFVKLRWLAAGGLAVLGLLAPHVVPGLSGAPLVWIAFALFVYNAFFRLTLHRLAPTLSIHLQIALDWVALIGVCHYTGGVESPFILFFFLHVVLASIFVSRAECFLQGLFGILLMTAMAFLEFTGTWPLPMQNVRPYPRYASLTYLLIFLDSFAAVILCTMYLATAVVQQLRKREEKLLELQDDLSRAYDELVALDRAKSRFVNLVAHEIRSPLAATQSLLRVALEGYAGEVSEKVRELLSRSEHRLLQLLELVNELLDLVRGGQQLPEEDKVDIGILDSISRILKEMEGRAAEKKIHLVFSKGAPSAIFRGDSQDLERIFINLIGNAIKYTPEGGTVTVAGNLLQDNFFHLEVCDTGIGIPPEEISRVFDEFFRASNAKRELKTGTGLGLSIVKKTVEKYGGRVDVKSEVGRGSCFSVYLPVITLLNNGAPAVP